MKSLRPIDDPPAGSRCGQDNPQQGCTEEKRIPDDETSMIDPAPALDVLPVLVRKELRVRARKSLSDLATASASRT